MLFFLLGNESKQNLFTFVAPEGSRVTIEAPTGEKTTFLVPQKNSSTKNEVYLTSNQNRQNSFSRDYSCKTNSDTDDLYD